MTEEGLKFETFNQSRKIIDGSIVWTHDIIAKNCFIETTEYAKKDENREDLIPTTTGGIVTTIPQGIYLSKSMPYICATHMLHNNGATKTQDDFFEAIFQMKV